jgi:very-short-patch-repair endonuclease
MIWHALRRNALGAKFRRQEPKGPYILDFVCHPYQLVIEIDGDSHADNPPDATRDAWLCQQGYTVLRFSNRDIYESLDGVLARIEQALIEAGATTPSQPAG